VERITLWAFALFSVFWTILVYCPLAHWVFYPGGWLASWGVLDFAGGLVVETASGVSAFVLAFWLGPGQTMHGGHGSHKPHNIPFVMLGAGLLWVGWYGETSALGVGEGGGALSRDVRPSGAAGFNAGSALASGYLAGRAFANTHLCASAAMGESTQSDRWWREGGGGGGRERGSVSRACAVGAPCRRPTLSVRRRSVLMWWEPCLPH
jgi:ammonium transporter, Amt family